MNSNPAPTIKPIGLIAFLVTCFVALYFSGMPSPKGMDADPSQFSAARASVYLKKVSEEIHPVGSEAVKRVRDYLMEQLRTYGLEPEIQEGSYSDTPMYNVVARLKGKSSKQTLLIVGHYDSTKNSYGAGDDGAAVSAILESLRALKTGPALENDVIILFTDGEENGLWGAHRFVNNHPWASEVDFILNFEGRGSKGPVIMFETSDNNRWIMSEFLKSTDSPVAFSISYEIYKRMPNGTDFTELQKIEGSQGLNFAFLGGASRYHSPDDNFANFDQGTFQHMGDQMLSALRHFGNIEIQPGDPTSDIYFYIPLMGVHGYSSAMVLPLLGLIVILFLGFTITGFRAKKLTLGGSVGGFLLAACFLVASVLVSLISFMGSRIIGHPLIRQATGHPEQSEIYFFAFFFLSLGVVSGLARLASRKVRVENLAFGGLLVWVILSAFLSLTMPGGSYLFAVPSLFMAAGLWASLRWDDEPLDCNKKAWVLNALAIFPLLVYLPLAQLFYLALPFPIPAILSGLLIGLLGLLMIAPLRWALPDPHQKWVPRLLILAGLLVLLTMTVINRGGQKKGAPMPEPSVPAQVTEESTAPAPVTPEAEATPAPEASEPNLAAEPNEVDEPGKDGSEPQP